MRFVLQCLLIHGLKSVNVFKKNSNKLLLLHLLININSLFGEIILLFLGFVSFQCLPTYDKKRDSGVTVLILQATLKLGKF